MRRIRVAAAAATGLLALTACGGGGDFSSLRDKRAPEKRTGGESAGPSGVPLADLPAEEIFARANEALQSVDSLRMRLVEEEPLAGGYTVELHLDRAGSCVASLARQGEGSIEILVREGHEVWMKPDTEFWRTEWGVTDPTMLFLFDGSYLYGSTTDPEFEHLAGMCALEEMLAEMAAPDSSEDSGPTDVGAVTEYNGIPAIPISGPDESGAETTMLVAAEGEPYPLHYSGESDEGFPQEMELTDFDEPVHVVEPPADQVLDLAQFRADAMGV